MYSMNYIGKFISNFRDFYNEINTATLTGAIDVIVVEQPDGSFTCSPFHVRFGKLGVLRSREKVVDIEINGEPLDIHMKLGESGEAFFVEEISADELSNDVPPHLACSPIPTENGFPLHFHRSGGSTSTLAIHSSQNDEWSRRRSNSEVIKRPPKQTVDQTFAQDDIQEHKPSNDLDHDLVYEWIPESKSGAMGYGSAPDLANSEAFSTNSTPVITIANSAIGAEVMGTNSSNSVPRTFKAETVNSSGNGEKTRKLSTVSGEFRPITDILTPDSPPSNSDALATSETGAVEENVEENVKSCNVSKRKRRKRSLMKKKGGNNSAPQRKNSEAGEASDTSTSIAWESATSVLSTTARFDASKLSAEPAVFTMDDVDGPVQDTATPSSSSSTAADTMSADTPTSPVEPSKVTSTLADELSRDLCKIQNASTEADFHFFSDTEILPGNSRTSEAHLSRSSSDGLLAAIPVTKPVKRPIALPVAVPPSLLKFFPDDDSRPCSPIQSDTEFETTKRPCGAESSRQSVEAGAGAQQSWRWGELPSPPVRHSAMTAPTGNTSSDDEGPKQQENVAAQKSMLSGMFSFMKKTKRIRHNPESEGIYLSELNVEELDPEVAALYFPTSYHRQGCPAPDECTSLQRDEDAESGNGPSLPQSPHSVEGAIGGPKSVDSDFEEPKHSIFEKKSYGEISLSLCGNLNAPNGPSEESFMHNLVTFNDMARNPKMIEDPNLVVRLNGQFFNWKTACPLVMSLVIYQQPLPMESVNKLTKDYMPNVQANTSSQSQQVKQTESVAGGRGYSSWFYWRRSSSTSEPKKISSDPGVASGVNEPMNNAISSSTILEMPDDSYRSGDAADRDSRPQSLDIPSVGAKVTIPHGGGTVEDQGLHDLPKDSLREEGYNGSNSSDSDDARSNGEKSQGVKIPIERRSYYQAPEKYRKTLRLSSEQIAQLNLQEGTNEVVFSVTTAYQGTTRCKCNIYRWRYDDKIVISDIDGTITKSDVLGHILPIVGKDWAQSGVAQLFTKIQNNGYRLLYLSARAIGQARVTREYLRSIKQDDLSLPDGPLLLSPTSLMSALHREVIERKPEEFKISCLRDIQALFPTHCKPFYAGYGNKINDVWAYRAVGIPIFRIFTINHRGELKHELTQTFQSSYINMSCIVDQMFPPLLEEMSEDYSNFAFWREPIADIQPDKIAAVSISTPPVPNTGITSDGPSKSKQSS